MADILTLAEARSALGWGPGRYLEKDPDLLAIWIPLVTEAIESPRVCGRLDERQEYWRTTKPSPLATRWDSGDVVEVWLNGTRTTGWTWVAPVLTITDSSYTAGDEVTVWASGLPVPQMVKAAAMATLKSVYNTQSQGVGSDTRPVAPESSDADVLLPPIAWKLTAQYRPTGGFA